MFCRKCGRRNLDENDFCIYCGNALDKILSTKDIPLQTGAFEAKKTTDSETKESHNLDKKGLLYKINEITYLDTTFSRVIFLAAMSVLFSVVMVLTYFIAR